MVRKKAVINGHGDLMITLIVVGVILAQNVARALCPRLNDPLNGRVAYGNRATNDIATYNCYNGYTLSGTSVRRCQASGSWTGSTPTCQPYDCNTPSDPVDGQAVYVNTTFGSSLQYECNTGYNLTAGHTSSTCTGTGWSGTVPTCTIYDCGNLTSPTNGSMTSDGTVFSSTANFTCDPGFDRLGEGSLLCNETGTWTGVEPVCQIVECDSPPNVTSATTTYSATYYQSTAKYECKIGYILTGNNITSCLANGTWEAAPSCDIVDCLALSNITNGTVAFDSTTYAAIATYECDIGHYSNDSMIRACGADKTWNGTEPTCHVYDCRNLTELSFGTVTFSATTYSSVAIYDCNAGYNMTSGNATRSCEIPGSWSGTKPVCEPVDCGNYTAPDNGTTSFPSGTTFGSISNSSCFYGYHTVGGDDVRACGADGWWNGTLLSCEIDVCSNLTSPTNGSMLGFDTVFNTTVTFECDEGFTLNGSSILYCQAGGSWNGTEPLCDINLCPDNLTNPDNGQVNTYDGVGYQSLAAYTCLTGYNINGSNWRECQANGTWSFEAPTCDIYDCGSLLSPDNCTVLTPNGTTYQNRAQYICDSGFELNGTEFRTCQDGGNWTDMHIINICQPKDCQALSNITNGTVVFTSTTYPSEAIYTCDTGYYSNDTMTRSCGTDGNWTEIEPTCFIYDCLNLSHPDNGVVTVLTTTYQATARYECNPGYNMTSGNETRSCEIPGDWSGTKPLCEPVDCENHTSPDNGTVSFLTGTTFGSSSNSSCLYGYHSVGGDDVRTCGVDGWWNGTLLSCEIDACSNLTSPSNGSMLGYDTVFNTTVTFECDEGFTLNGSIAIYCQAGGSWNGTKPQCDINVCPDNLTKPDNGQVNTYDGVAYQSVAAYTCLTGYKINGSNWRICQANGTWSFEAPTCDIYDCGSLTSPDNGTVLTPNGTTYEEIAQYTCDSGFDLNGTEFKTCQDGGNWTDMHINTVCQPKDCLPLSNITNGTVVYASTTYPSEATYACDTGYYSNDTLTRSCGTDGNWTGIEPTCIIYDCTNLTNPANGFVTVSETTYMSIATYECHPGYNMTSGNDTRVCDIPGDWNGTKPVCDPFDCGNHTAPDNGTVIFNSDTVFGSTSNSSCRHGYHSVGGDDVRTCGADGWWNGTLLSCAIDVCRNLTSPTNGSMIGTDNVFDITVTFECDEGFMLNGTNTLYCQAGGSWNGTEPLCDINVCPDNLTNPENGQVNTYDGVGYQSLAAYTCLTGYKINGSNWRECQANGTWSFEAPTCEIYDCGNLTSPDNGTVLTPNGTTYQEKAQYICDSGFDLNGTEFRTCQDGGNWTNMHIVNVCLPKDCLALSNITNGTVVFTSTTYPSEATYTCDTGYYSNDTMTRSCGTDGNWTEIEPTCFIYDCFNLSDPDNGVVIFSMTTYLSNASYECNSGYNLTSGNDTRSCEIPGDWSGTKPVCEPVDCGNHTAPDNGTVSSLTGTTFGSVSNASCLYGYHSVGGDDVRTCGADGWWNGTLLSCEIDVCSNLTSPTNGSMLGVDTVFESIVAFGCDEGFTLNGSSILYCQAGGSWNGSEPECDIKLCPDNLTNPENGQVNTYDGVGYQSLAAYTCLTGYKINGSNWRECQANGTWSFEAPTCEIYDCGNLTSPDNGTVLTLNGTTYQERAQYICDSGFDLNGTEFRTCQDGGNWTDMHIYNVCQPRDCLALSNITNGTVYFASTTYPSDAAYICDTGYYSNDTMTRSCGTDGNWTGIEPSCSIYDCFDLSDPDNGAVTVSTTTYLSNATYECNPGYNMTSGNETRSCEIPGVWSGTKPICEPVDCGNHTAPENGTVTFLTGTTFGRTSNSSCLVGYHSVGGDEVRTCGADGWWNGTLLSCEIDDCGVLVTPYGGEIDNSAKVFGTVVTFTCDPGHYMTGTPVLECMAGSRWNGSEPNCTIHDCGNLPDFLYNGTVNATGTLYGDTFTYVCDEGYIMGDRVLNRTLTCTGNGTWDGDVENCTIVDCGALDHPVDGRTFTPNTLYGAKASYTCDSGYTMIGDNIRQCMADGLWDPPTPPICRIINCGNLTSPHNCSVKITYEDTTFSAFAHYTCSPGYEVVSGNTTRECLENGQWSGDEAVCERKDCGTITSYLPNGTITGNTTFYEDTRYYVCDEGYVIEPGTTEVLLECLETGLWNNTAPTECVPVDCGSLSHPVNGRVEYPDTNYLTQASYTCNPGYDLYGQHVRACQANALWDKDKPNCQIKDCGNITLPLDCNCTVIATLTTFNSRAEFVCHLGYRLTQGELSHRCNEDGDWTGSAPTCQLYDCKDLSNPDQGSVDLSEGTLYNATATYGCVRGYYISAGNQTRVCQDGGEWSGAEPTCTIHDCGEPAVNPHSNFTQVSGNTTYQSSIRYTCDTGYTISGGTSLQTCTDTGQWSDVPINCTIRDCLTPPTLQNGNFVAPETTYEAIAYYSCYEGYEISGGVDVTGQPNRRQLECGAGGSWLNTLPSCSLWDCQSLNNISHGWVDLSEGTLYNASAEYHCVTGYYINKAYTPQTCQDRGQWSGTEPYCTIFDCKEVPDVDWSTVDSPVNTTYGQVANYSCVTGYNQTGGDASLTCEHGGVWAGNHIVCERVDCGRPTDNLQNGYRTVYGTRYEDVTVYECDEGYTFADNVTTRMTLHCTDTGQWSEEVPLMCYIVDCGTLDNPMFGSVDISEGKVYRSKAVYDCNHGYRLEGTNSRNCTVNGEWSGNPPVCIMYNCENLTSIDHGHIDYSSTLFSSVARYECDTGHYISFGDPVRTCQDGGDWSGTPPTCTIHNCRTPPTLQGNVSTTFMNTSRTLYGDMVVYQCGAGSVISGLYVDTFMVTCGENGTWTGMSEQLECALVDCGRLSHPVNGDVDTSSGTGLGDQAAYTCDDGHYMMGRNVRYCQANGNWTGPAPTCQIYECNDPEGPMNGKGHYNRTTYGAVVTFDCNTGYFLVGNNFQTCLEGYWSGAVPTCIQEFDCGFQTHDVILAMQISPDLDEAEFMYIKSSFRQMLLYSHMDSNITKIGFFLFGDNVWPESIIDLTDNSTELLMSLENIRYRNVTGYPEAATILDQVAQMFDDPSTNRAYASDVAVVAFHRNFSITDEISASTWLQLDKVHLITVAVGFDGTEAVNFEVFGEQAIIYLMSDFKQFYSDLEWTSSSCDCGFLRVQHGNVTYSRYSHFNEVIFNDPHLTQNISHGDTFYRSVAMVTCAPGYQVLGEERLTCAYGGKWSPQLEPLCEPVNHTGYECGFEEITLGIDVHLDFNKYGEEYYTIVAPFIQQIIWRTNLGTALMGLMWRNGSTYSNVESWTFGSKAELLNHTQTVDCTLHETTGNLWDYITSRFEYARSLAPHVPLHHLIVLTPDDFDLKNRPVFLEKIEELRRNRIHVDIILMNFTSPGFKLNSMPDLGSYWAKHLYNGPEEFLQYLYRPHCDCGLIDAPEYGDMVYGEVPSLLDIPLPDTFYLGTVQFSCNAGFVVDGPEQIMCGKSGRWSQPPPICTYDGLYNFECGVDLMDLIIGVQVDLNSYSDGYYDKILPSIDALLHHTNMDTGRARVGMFWFGTEALYTEDIGKFGDKNSLMERIHEVNISSSKASITAALGQVNSMFYSNYSRSGVPHHAIIFITPETNLTDFAEQRERLMYSSVTVDFVAIDAWSENGSWPGLNELEPALKSLLIDGPTALRQILHNDRCKCPELSIGENVTMQSSGGPAFFMTTVTFKCDPGHVLTGSKEIECGLGGQWKGIPPTCTYVECGSLASPAHGTVRYSSGIMYKSVASFQCSRGYYLSQHHDTRTCMANGTWSGTDPYCIIHDCGGLTRPDNGNMDIEGTLYGTTARFSCSVGYQLSGSDEVTCGATGIWSDVEPTCHLTDCGRLPTLEFGKIEISNTTFGQTATHSCLPGYVLIGRINRVCQADGQWSGNPPMCQPRDCGTVSEPSNGFVDFSNGTTFGRVAMYRCRQGYRLEGHDRAQCMASGDWLPVSPPRCFIIDCGSVTEPVFGFTTYSRGTQYGSVVKFTCSEGYNLSGPDEITCTDTGAWSNLTRSTCNIVNCGPLPDLQFGRIVYAGGRTTYQSEATFHCEEGRELGGRTDVASTTCSVTGDWDVTLLPECVLKDCGRPPTVQFASVIGTETVYGSSVLYQCDAGYRVQGRETIVCTAQGQWSAAPVCQPVACSTLVIEHADVTYFGTTFGSTARVDCDRGYMRVGEALVTCQSMGRWGPTLPQCIIKDCGRQNAPGNGSVSFSRATVAWSEATFSCNPGYDLSGPQLKQCSPDTARWEPATDPVCQPKDCGQPVQPDRGSVDTSGGTVYGRTASFFCDQGYDLFGEETIVCTETGDWSATSPTCQPTDCGGLSNPAHGTVRVSGTRLNQVAVYTCDIGYYRDGPYSRTCGTDGEWTGPEPVCRVQGEQGSRPRRATNCNNSNTSGCGEVTSPQFGYVAYDGDTTFGQTAKYGCYPGYNLVGEAVTRCENDSRWSPGPPACVAKDCGTLPAVPNTNRISWTGLTEYGHNATFACKIGYTTRNDNEIFIECTEYGTWSQVLYPCQVVDCGRLSAPDFGSVTGSTTYGSTLTFSCDLGYNLIGSQRVQCLSNSSWSDTVPECVIQKCSQLSQPVNGQVTYSSVDYLSWATYSCNHGYEPVGGASAEMSRMCRADGTWSNSAPVCTRKSCPALSAPVNGYVALTNRNLYESVATFSCMKLHNRLGSEQAVCGANGAWSATVPTCQPQAGLTWTEVIKATFNFSIPAGDDLSDPATLERYYNELYNTLQGKYNGAEMDILSVKRGSLLVEYRVILPDNEDSIRMFAQVTGGIQQGQVIEFLGQNIAALQTCVANNCQAMTADEFLCLAFTSTQSCDPGYVCVVTTNGLPECRIDTSIDCGLPRTIPNSVLDADRGTTLGETVEYICNPGYQVTPHNTRTCQADGKWAPAEPMCVRVDCGILTDPANGVVYMNEGTKFGDQATFVCNSSYSIIGRSHVTCMEDGNWELPLPECSSTVCGSVFHPDNGLVYLSMDGLRAVYTCDTGYRLMGSYERVCEFGFWSGDPATCAVIDCGPLDNPVNGRVVTGSGSSYGAVATYSCVSLAYQLTGVTTRTCQETGRWSSIAPYCELIDCGHLFDISNGYVTMSGTKYSDSAIYRCDAGYILQGTSILTCLRTGWSDVPPTCRPKGDCGQLDDPAFGFVTYGSTLLGSVANYECYIGYTLTGNDLRQCMSNNSWSGATPVCTAIDCGLPSSPMGGSVEAPAGTTYGKQATFTCNTGYTRNGPSSITCKEDGQWSDVTTCSFIDCRSLTHPDNGHVETASGTTFGSAAVYSCNTGYIMQGTRERQCQENGQWSGSEPYCVILDCGSPSNPANGNVYHTGGTTYGKTARYECKTGYNLVGQQSRLCGSNGLWTGQAPICESVDTDCGQPPSVPQGQATVSRHSVTGVVTATYTCDQGYLLSDSSLNTLTCSSNNVWQGQTPVCRIVDCGSPGSPANGNVYHTGGTTYGQVARYECQTGYTLVGQQTQQCAANGQWAGTAPVCQLTVVGCGQPPSIPNASVTLSGGTTKGATATYTCNSGYLLSASSSNRVLTCGSGDRWLGQQPTCVRRSCGTLPVPEFGEIFTSTGTVYGSVITFTCYTGYAMSGSERRVCMASGHWNGTQPVCTLVDCGPPPSTSNGNVTTAGGTTYSRKARYSCKKGYKIHSDDSSMRTCQSNGQWSGRTPRCRSEDDNFSLAVGLGVGLTGFVILVLIIIVIIFMITSRKQRPRKSSKQYIVHEYIEPLPAPPLPLKINTRALGPKMYVPMFGAPLLVDEEDGVEIHTTYNKSEIDHPSYDNNLVRGPSYALPHDNYYDHQPINTSWD